MRQAHKCQTKPAFCLIDKATWEIYPPTYTRPLHDALPIEQAASRSASCC
eukprot:COSAG02_NODE_66251_length_256_cov_0.585987_1_plen_49_part_01